MNRKRRIACLLALLTLCILVFPACSAEETEPEPTVTLTADELEQYTIVRPDIADESIVRCGMALREAFVEAGHTLRLTTDFTREGIDEFEIHEKEILLGATNREETEIFLDALCPWQWGYGIVNGKIVVAGHDDETTFLAVQKFMDDIVSREPLTFSDTDSYIDGATFEGEGRIYSVLAVDFTAEDSPSVGKVLEAVRDDAPEIVAVSGLSENDTKTFEFALDGYLAGVRVTLGETVTAIYYDTSKYTYSTGDQMPLLNYPNLTEEERGALVYTVLRSIETEKKITFAVSNLPEDESAGGRMRAVAGFLEHSSRIPAVVVRTGAADEKKSAKDACDSRFLAVRYADAHDLTSDTEGESAGTASVYLPYEKLTAVRVTERENGIVYAEFQKTKN